MRKYVGESVDIQSVNYEKVDDLIELFQRLADKYGGDAELEIDHDSLGFTYSLNCYRLETDAEVKKREKIARKARERRKKLESQKEDQEYREYIRLKNTFEK